MGSEVIPQRTKDGSIHVLVTGYDSFGRHTQNPSWLVARSLPETLHGTKHGGRKIHIHVRPQPVRVSYTYVREQIPSLVVSSDANGDGSVPNFDVVVHMGVSHARGFYEMETRAFRDDYFLADVDGKTEADGFQSWREEGAPEMLRIGFDAAAVHKSWKANDADVRISADAGRYLCEYILFTTLYEYHHKLNTDQAPVTFLHVPTGSADHEIEKGKDVAIALIQALVQNIPK